MQANSENCKNIKHSEGYTISKMSLFRQKLTKNAEIEQKHKNAK